MSAAWIAVALALGAANATSLPEDVQGFAQKLSSAQHLELVQSWKVPGERGDAWLLRFVNPSDRTSHQMEFVLWAGPDAVFTRRAFNAGKEIEVVPDAAHRRFSLRLTEDAQTYGIRNGRPELVTVTRKGKLGALGQGTEVEDWDTLTFHRTLEKGEGKHTEVVETDEGAILLVTTDDPSSLPRTWTKVTDGRAHWRGAQDASFEVRAEPSDSGVALRLKVKDNTHVPVPDRGSDRAFAAADHFELWWKSPAGLRQVGVGLDKDGQPKVRALYLEGHGLALPTATVEDGALVLQFDAPSLGGDRAIARGVPFTVAYADADVKRKGTQSVVSTSAFHFRISTLGKLIALPGFARWPAKEGEAPWCAYRPSSAPLSWSDC